MITQIDENDIERSSTLTKRDLGKWAVVDNGCYFIKSTKQEVEELAKILEN